MTPKEATKLLDMAKDGEDIPEEVITEALEWTDDIAVSYTHLTLPTSP
jgi:hypothetical protein